MKVRSRMFAIIVIFSIIPVILVSYVINYTYNKNTEDTFLDNLASSVNVYEGTVNSFLEQKKINLETIGNIYDVQDYISNSNNDSNYYDSNIYKEIKNFINTIVDTSDYIINIDVVSKNDKILISSSEKRENTISTLIDKEKLKNIVDGKAIYTNAVVDDEKASHLSIASPVYDGNIYIGYITMDIGLNYMEQLAEKSEFYSTGYISVIDGNSYAVASKGPYMGKYVNQIYSDKENTFPHIWSEVSQNEDREGFFRYQLNGIKKIAYYNMIGDTDWAVVGNVDIDEVFLPLNKTGIIVAIFVFIILILDVIAFVLYARSITIPINKMIEATNEINKGDYSVRVKYDENDELGNIAKGFNRLMDSIQSNTNKLKNLNNDFSILTSNIPGGMIRYSLDGNFDFDFVSESFLKLMKCTRSDLDYTYGGSYLRIIDDEDVDYIRGILEGVRSDGDISELEYRIKRPDSSVVWVKDKTRVISDANGKRWAYTIMIDITVDKEYENAFKKSEERFSKLLSWSDNAVFEWDSVRGTVAVSDSIRAKLGYNPLKVSPDGKTLEIDNIFPDDRDKFYSLFDRIKEGQSGVEEEIRLKKISDNTYIWFRVKVGAMRTDNDDVYKYIGILYDIDSIKNHENIIKGRRDLFTGFYTRDGMELVVNDDIKKNTEYVRKALVIIDIRGFNHLKETMGVKFSETVISDISRKLTHIFDRRDCLCRISESRFAVFTSSAISRSMLIIKINEAMETIRSTYKNGDMECEIRSCVGASRFPKDGENFDILYQKAETSLFNAIQKGVGKYLIYEED